MTVKFLDLVGQYESIRDEVDRAIAEVISTASFIGGNTVSAFESEFAAFQSAEECVAVGNGTDAIEIALEALDLPAGSEVIVPANSFIASSEAVTRAGHQVVFCDIDPDTYLLDLEDVELRITPRTAAVVAVHLYGRPCDMTALATLAERHNLSVIEDSAQAHGAEHAGRRVGALGHVGTFSFFPGKNLGAYGDGGAIVTNDSALAQRCRMIANHGRSEKYLHEFEGRNSRLDALQAAVLTVKLRHLHGWVDRRNAAAATYLERLTGVGDLILPTPLTPGDRHAYHLFVVRSERSVDLERHLNQSGIQTGRHYPVALPDQPAYASHGLAGKTRASAQSPTLLSLPVGEHLTHDEMVSVCDLIADFFTQEYDAEQSFGLIG